LSRPGLGGRSSPYSVVATLDSSIRDCMIPLDFRQRRPVEMRLPPMLTVPMLLSSKSTARLLLSSIPTPSSSAGRGRRGLPPTAMEGGGGKKEELWLRPTTRPLPAPSSSTRTSTVELEQPCCRPRARVRTPPQLRSAPKLEHARPPTTPRAQIRH